MERIEEVVSGRDDHRRAAALAAVHAEAATVAYADIFPRWSAPPTAEDLTPIWHDMIVDPSWMVLAAAHSTGVVGVVAVGPDAEVPTGIVMAKLYVGPDHWHSGVGGRLHDEAVRRRFEPAVGMNLWVLEHNHRARAFYRRRGWRLIPGPTVVNDPPEVIDVLYQLGPGSH